MDTDKAYLLGLIIGGGYFGNAEDAFYIVLPYKKWGSYINNPSRAGQIADDILRKVGRLFQAVFRISIQYETNRFGIWRILFEENTMEVRTELQHYGIKCEGKLWNNADISPIINDLVDDNLKRRFVAGLADTVGSMAKSHRRFTDEHQILSLEIQGFNFRAVCNLCRLLYSINCIPDQVNWNHPNIHCTNDPYYSQWHKGFKLRILLDQYARFGAFAFRTKAEASNENRSLQHEVHHAEICEKRIINLTPSSVHPAENDIRIPEEIRNGHYIHFRHFCAVMGCEHAPYDKLDACMNELGKYVIPFPILHKDTVEGVQEIMNSDELLTRRTYRTMDVRVKKLLEDFDHDDQKLLWGTSNDTGYAITTILQAVAYVIAIAAELFGNRPRNGYAELVRHHVNDNPQLTVEIRRPDLLTPLIILGTNGRAAMVGATNPRVYEKLVSKCHSNPYKLFVRKITESDLQ